MTTPSLIVYTKHTSDDGREIHQFLTSGNTEAECHQKAKFALNPEWLDRYFILPIADADSITRNWYGLV